MKTTSPSVAGPANREKPALISRLQSVSGQAQDAICRRCGFQRVGDENADRPGLTNALGEQMLAVRANERSAAGAGVAVVRVKIIAFAIGSFIAGLGGSMLAYFQGNVTFISFSTRLASSIGIANEMPM